jgi:cupin fold WbuC family metalloprotein
MPERHLEMPDHTWIDTTLLDHASGLAAASPRGRRNFNFHRAESDASHRLLNAIEPGSYIRPHRHLDAAKDETLVVVRGRLGAVVFDEAGSVVDTAVLAAGGECCGINLPHGTYHTVLALEPKTVFFESKAGPYRPLDLVESAPWAPEEGARDALPYLAALRELFD